MQNHSNLTLLVGRAKDRRTSTPNTKNVQPGFPLKDPGHFDNTNTQTPLLNVGLEKKKEQPGHFQNAHTQPPLLNVGLKEEKKQPGHLQNTHTQAPLLNVGLKEKKKQPGQVQNTLQAPLLNVGLKKKKKQPEQVQNTHTQAPLLKIGLNKEKKPPGHIQNTHSQAPLLNVGLNKKRKPRHRKKGNREILDKQEKKPIRECPNLVEEIHGVEKYSTQSFNQLTTETRHQTPSTSQTAQNNAGNSGPNQRSSVSQAINRAGNFYSQQTPSTSQITLNSAGSFEPNQISSASQTALNRGGNMANQTPSMSKTVRNSTGSYKSNQEYSRNDQRPAYQSQSSNEGNQGNNPNPRIGKKARKKKVKVSPLWMTDDIRELLRMKKEAQVLVRRHNTELNRKKFFFLQDACTEHCRLAQKKYADSLKKQRRNQTVAEEQKTSVVAPVPQESGGSVFSRLQPKQHEEELTAASVKRSELYSPTEGCREQTNEEDQPEVSDSDAGHRRLSAFDRLGPLTAKKPKLTINLSLDNEQSVREVVQETAYVPFHEREDVLASTNETVVKYLPIWPWKKSITYKKTLTVRASKSVMLMEKEQVDETYGKSNLYFLVSIKGYPPSWAKEDVLDVILANLKGKSFVPCFIEFSKDECKFFVNNSRMALLEIHSLGFLFRQRDVELSVSISQLHLTASQLQFLPRTVLRKLVEAGRDGTKLDLKAFTLQKDLSHFLYFPLNRIYNQRELVQNTSAFEWKNLTHLDLAHNKLKSLDGFNLPSYTPNLRSLDLSHNHIPTLPTLLSCRGLPLRSLWLEGNPLCLDVHRDSYVEAVRTMFTSLKELDGEPITLQGEMPKFWKNFCPYEAVPVVEKYLETFYPLLDSPNKERIESMYDKNAVLTVTFRSKLRHDLDNIRCLRYLFLKCRIVEQKVYDYVRGAASIRNVIEKWPQTMHDPTTFTVDVLHHTDDTTLLKVVGVLKIVSDSLAEDEHLLVFSRTLLLHSSDGVEYTIKQEMLYWDEPEMGLADSAFKLIRIQNKQLELKFDSTPDEKIQEELIEAFMKLTQLEAKPSRKCLEAKEWHFKNALEYFIKLLKLDNVGFLYKSNEN